MRSTLKWEGSGDVMRLVSNPNEPSAVSGGGRRSCLTVAQVKSLPPGKYHDGGGVSLLLRVDGIGARLWTQRVMVRGKRREIGLGGFPTVTWPRPAMRL